MRRNTDLPPSAPTVLDADAYSEAILPRGRHSHNVRSPMTTESGGPVPRAGPPGRNSSYAHDQIPEVIVIHPGKIDVCKLRIIHMPRRTSHGR